MVQAMDSRKADILQEEVLRLLGEIANLDKEGLQMNLGTTIEEEEAEGEAIFILEEAEVVEEDFETVTDLVLLDL